jgi:NAD(P)-dependent dehydrogenase (short-subunit alcohol dehydrogenase family)
VAEPWPGKSRAVLITGCGSSTGLSSGTGQRAARMLHERGWDVYATGRSREGLAPLTEAGLNTRLLDVTDESSMLETVSEIEERHGSVGVLVNNAAYSLNGTFLDTPLSSVRHQFDTNLFGLVKLTQLVLPGMIAARSGRIVMMSSIFALFATAGRGYYEATKYALEAVSDSLRLEVDHLGIDVAVIEPSPIRGGFVPTSVTDLGLAEGSDPELYQEFWKYFVDWHGAYREVEHPRGRGRTAITADGAARVLVRAVEAPTPRIRYRIGVPVRVLSPMRSLIGERNWDRFVRAFFPTPAKALRVAERR